MQIIRSYKTELHPNNAQATMLAKHAGCARFAYNWALATLKEQYEKQREEIEQHILSRRVNGEAEHTEKELKAYKNEVAKKYLQPSAITLHKLLIEKKNTEFQWMKEVSKWSPQNALRHLEVAYKRFFKKLGKFPRFKKKDVKESFTLDSPVIVANSWIQLPKIGKIRLFEHGYLPEGTPKSATISKKAGRWFASISYEVEVEQKQYNNTVIGVDLGIKSLAVFSDGTYIRGTDRLNSKESLLKRLQRKASRQIKGSFSRRKTQLNIQKLHFDISNHRKDVLQKATTLLAKTKSSKVVVLEDLNVKGMTKNHCLAKAISNAGFGEFRRQIEYKAKWYGKELVVADRFFPSSKMDHKSGEYLPDLELSDRVIYHSDGTETDRDLNAAINLEDYGVLEMNKNTVRYTGINAGGEERSIESQDLRCSSRKPESNNELLGLQCLDLDKF